MTHVSIEPESKLQSTEWLVRGGHSLWKLSRYAKKKKVVSWNTPLSGQCFGVPLEAIYDVCFKLMPIPMQRCLFASTSMDFNKL